MHIISLLLFPRSLMLFSYILFKNLYYMLDLSSFHKNLMNNERAKKKQQQIVTLNIIHVRNRHRS